jgi:hypothetical protein
VKKTGRTAYNRWHEALGDGTGLVLIGIALVKAIATIIIAIH